ncbi:MAG: TlpA family protein disulfide reductase [Longimicrobiales bacterium]
MQGTRRLRPGRAAGLAFTLAAAVGPSSASAQDVGIAIGTNVEPVQVEDLDGNPVDLAQYIGERPVLLEFWATWCPLCEALEPRLEAARSKYGDAFDLVLIAVAVNQNPRSIRRHLERHPLPGRVLWDTDGRATRAFQAPTTSYIVILDAEGRVTYTGVGEDQDLDAALSRTVGT